MREVDFGMFYYGWYDNTFNFCYLCLQPDLASHEVQMRQKISLLCLMEVSLCDFE